MSNGTGLATAHRPGSRPMRRGGAPPRGGRRRAGEGRAPPGRPRGGAAPGPGGRGPGGAPGAAAGAGAGPVGMVAGAAIGAAAGAAAEGDDDRPTTHDAERKAEEYDEWRHDDDRPEERGIRGA